MCETPLFVSSVYVTCRDWSNWASINLPFVVVGFRCTGADCAPISFFVATDCFVETCLATDHFVEPIPNSGCWSSPVAEIYDIDATLLPVKLHNRCFARSRMFFAPDKS